MEANIKEYKAQEKRRAIKAAARAARQERAMKAKIIEERAKKTNGGSRGGLGRR